jgi:hypothetical protein
LFQYEYFDLFHRCIIDFRINGLIRDKNLETILATF